MNDQPKIDQMAVVGCMVLAPEDTRHFSRTERDKAKILGLWQEGFAAGHRAAETVRSFWTE